MTTKTFVTIAIALIGATFGATAARAGEATYDYPVAFTSTLSRAEVQAEAQRARAAGQIDSGERSFVVATTGTALTRAQVLAELHEAVRLGALSDGERNVFPTAMQLESIRLAGLKALSMPMASR